MANTMNVGGAITYINANVSSDASSKTLTITNSDNSSVTLGAGINFADAGKRTKAIKITGNSKDNSINRIQVYDWEGNYIDYIRVAAYQEIESMFHIGDDLYICFNASGGYLFKAKLEEDKMAR